MIEMQIVAAAIQDPTPPGSGTFEPAPSGIWIAFETIGPWLLLTLAGVVVVRAVLHRRRYRALVVLGEPEQAAVHDALVAAERRTIGEIVPVVVERSDLHPGASWIAALATLLIGTTLLEGVLPWDHPAWLLACQLGLCGCGYSLARLLPDIQRRFISEPRATRVAEEQAFQEFYRLGLHKTEAATGVLIFTSLLERRVVVLGDQGIAEHLPEDFWTGVREAILAGIRRGSLRDGLVDGIGLAGAALAEHAPWREGDRNELPDRLIVRRE